MEDISLAMQDFLDGLLDDVISDLKIENQEYKACKEEEKNNADKFDELLERVHIKWTTVNKKDTNLETF